jgi:hypothetical protein
LIRSLVVLRRLVAWLAGLWGGLLLGVGLIGAPAGFAVAAADVAGRSAGRMFAVEAYVSLATALLLLMALRRSASSGTAGEAAPVFNTNVLLLLGALFCTVAGYFGLQPMMAAARAGQGSLSFGALHGLAAGLFALKTLLVLLFAWRLGAA